MMNQLNEFTGKIVRIDASSLTDSHCFLKLWNKIVEGHLEKRTNNDTHYGSCWHIFREEYGKLGCDEMAGMKAVSKATKAFKEGMASGNVIVKDAKSYLNEGHLVQVCMRYIEEFGGKPGMSFGDFKYLVKGAENNPLIEQTFSIPLYQSDELVILFQGTIDEIGKFNSGFHAFGDDKTTSSYKVDDYLAEHQMKPQLTAYAWAIKWMAKNGEEGNYLSKFVEQPMGGFINGVFLNKDPDKTEFKRSKIFPFKQSHLDEFEDALMNLVLKIVHTIKGKSTLFKEGKFNGTCSGNFGKCLYWGSCNAPDEIARISILNSSFPRREYTPLNFRK